MKTYILPLLLSLSLATITITNSDCANNWEEQEDCNDDANFQCFRFQLGSGGVCDHAATYAFTIVWSKQSDFSTSSSFSTILNSDVTATYLSYTDSTETTCGTTAGTTSTYYAVTDSTNSATGRVVTAQSVDGTDSKPCGYKLTLTANNNVIVEYGTDNSYLLSLGLATLLSLFVIF